jgi:hypothetical protein
LYFAMCFSVLVSELWIDLDLIHISNVG